MRNPYSSTIGNTLSVRLDHDSYIKFLGYPIFTQQSLHFFYQFSPVEQYLDPKKRI